MKTYTFEQAFQELIQMECMDQSINDEDASLQMMLIYWGV